MHIYIVFAHPSRKYFTYSVLKSFKKGLLEAEHSFETGDLYKMDFRTDMILSQIYSRLWTASDFNRLSRVNKW